MKLLLILSVAALSRAEELVEAKEIPAAVVTELKAAEANVEASIKALLAAQEALAKAKATKENLVQKAMSAVHVYEGQCSGAGPSWPHTKKFRRSSVNGRYVLIHEGAEGCPNAISLTTGLGLTLEGPSK